LRPRRFPSAPNSSAPTPRTSSTAFLRSFRPRVPRIATAGFAASAIAALAACSSSFRDIAPTPAQSAAEADQLFESLANRFNAVAIAPHYDAARTKIAKSALVPSRVFDDTSVWEGPLSGAGRRLYVSGTIEDGRYRLDSRPALTPPARVGDTRHTIALTQVAPSIYRWDTQVDMGIGSMSPRGMSVFLNALVAAPHGRTERELRDDYRAVAPRAVAAFGRGFAIDSIRVVPSAGDITNVALTVCFHPETMRSAFPAFAGYLDKYLGPAKYHIALADRAGVPMFDIAGRDRAITVRYRLHDGHVTSLAGAPRAWPDTLVLTADVSLKVKFFTVGFKKLVTELAITESPHERAWTIIAQHEPDWDLPLVTERLIRTPLHRPFEGAGSMFRVAVRDSGTGTTGMTVFERRARLEVQESAIMRFLGSLGAHAIGDLDGKVEVEEDRFLHDGFVALQADVRALRR